MNIPEDQPPELEFRWFNTMLGNLKTGLNGTYHAINHAKYAHRYLAQFAYRFYRRFNLAAMVPLAARRRHYQATSLKPPAAP